MDLQERLQAVQAEHQDITQQIADADAGMAENQRAYEESQGNYYAARANAQLQVRFLEGQMAAYSAMMQDEALKQTQESTADDVNRFLQAAMDSTPPAQRLAMLNGMHERLSGTTGVESDA